MRLNTIHKIAFWIGLTAPAFLAWASDNDALLAVLSCSRIEAHWRLLNDVGVQQPDGTLLIAGPVRSGDACVADAHVSGSFGALIIVGRVCSASTRPLVDFVRRSRPRLTEVNEPPHPGVIASYVDGRYSLGFLRGIARPAQEPVPDDSVTSYMCSYQGSGPP